MLITLVTIIDVVLRSHLLLAAVYLLALPWFPFPGGWRVSPWKPDPPRYREQAFHTPLSAPWSDS